MVFGMIVVVILVMEVVILMYVSMRIAAVFVVVGLIALPYAMTFSIGYLNLLKSGGHMVGKTGSRPTASGPRKTGTTLKRLRTVVPVNRREYGI